jgi:hypothetical protein
MVELEVGPEAWIEAGVAARPEKEVSSLVPPFEIESFRMVHCYIQENSILRKREVEEKRSYSTKTIHCANSIPATTEAISFSYSK